MLSILIVVRCKSNPDVLLVQFKCRLMEAEVQATTEKQRIFNNPRFYRKD